LRVQVKRRVVVKTAAPVPALDAKARRPGGRSRLRDPSAGAPRLENLQKRLSRMPRSLTVSDRDGADRRQFDRRYGVACPTAPADHPVRGQETMGGKGSGLQPPAHGPALVGQGRRAMARRKPRLGERLAATARRESRGQIGSPDKAGVCPYGHRQVGAPLGRIPSGAAPARRSRWIPSGLVCAPPRRFSASVLRL
jgi:hypothetical protein